MSPNRLVDYLNHIQQAASDAYAYAYAYVESISLEEFLIDRRTQQAIIMNFIIIGEAATKIMDQYGDFIANHSEIPWRSMRGMRNRIAHGYFDIDLELVWNTVQTELPQLLLLLPVVCDDAINEG